MATSGYRTDICVSVPDEEVGMMLEVTRAESKEAALIQLARHGLWMLNQLGIGIVSSNLNQLGIGADDKPISRDEYETWTRDAFVRGSKMTKQESEEFWNYIFLNEFKNSFGRVITKKNVWKTCKAWLDIHHRESASHGRINSTQETEVSDAVIFARNKRMLAELEED